MRFPTHLLTLAEDPALPWRQAACAAVGVGVPVLAALWLHNPYGVLFGAVGGLYASLLDFGGTLGHRLFTQFAGLLLVASCGMLGGWLGPHHGLLWLTLGLLTFGIGWVDGNGAALETILRFAALMLLVYAFIPIMPPGGLPFFGLGMAVGLAAVWLDSLVWPRALPTAHAGLPAAWRQIAGGHSAGWLHALGFSLCTCTAMWLAVLLHYQRPAWVAAVTLFVIRPDGPDSLRRLFQSVFGTLVGVAVAWCIAHGVSSGRVLLACVVALAFLRPIALVMNPWAQSATLTTMVLVLFDAALGPGGRAASLALLKVRLFDVLLGAAVAFVGMLLFNPKARQHFLARVRRKPVAA